MTAACVPLDNASMKVPFDDWPGIVLASTSPYRRELMQRLRVPFETVAPGVDEQPRLGESPCDLALRLAVEKAQAVASRRADDVVVIGSDQVAELDGQPLGKPCGHDEAMAQWRAMRGRSLVFHTALCVLRGARGYRSVEVVPVHVRCRDLSDEHIDTYLRLEQPYDCAGSAKCETLGIALLDGITCDDPTALVGLPLIATTRRLREAGADPLVWLTRQRGA